MPSDDVDEVPQRIGRYDVRDRLGCGATAVVYRGYDIGLQRDVAVKVPRAHLVASTQTANAFLTEARTLARLDHPNILPIFDLGRTDDGLCFFICKLFEGHSLKDRLAQGRPSIAETVEMVRCLAEALHYAHKQGLVHRDVKPANVLLDSEGRPVLADFDLALHPQDFGKGPTFVGTVGYMSPEQARREGHRVDARTDVYSLGVVLYEMLTGRLPFQAEPREELLEQIRSQPPLPPRQVDEAIPAELERICLKAMAKLPSERYATAEDMAEELRQFSRGDAQAPENATVSTVPASIVSRGLHAFSGRDADFFPELLPGPYDRVGLPEIIRFWKDRLDSNDPDTAFRVGLMLGPTGSGKSSLLQAGVLPRLATRVCAVRIECTPDDTETRLLQALRRHRPGLPADGTLPELVGRLRLAEGARVDGKVLIVLDQFEQWLHAQRDFAGTALVAALRQCDGVHVQALLLVRDDFGLAAARFLHELEVPIVGGVNFGTVDRFDPAHARKVLASFGRACGALPPHPAPLTAEQEQFLAEAVEELTEEGRVIPVRLVLLAEMMRARSWTVSALREVGGATGSAVVFLEEALGTRAVNPAHRPFQAPACSVLHTLLPARGEKLKGVKRSRQELLEAAGLTHDPETFDALLNLLSGELRLITPVESAEGAPGPAASYQLTHDYLVAPLRQWLTRQQRATPRGRAKLRLAEYADDWNAVRENRRLPSAWTWATIAALTRRQDWTESQQAMMRVATRYHLTRGAVVVALLLLALQGWRYLARREAAELAAQHAADEVAQLRSAPIRNVASILDRMQRSWADCEPRLRAALAQPGLAPQEERNVRIALLSSDPAQVKPLLEHLLVSRPDELLVLRHFLLPYREDVRGGLWRIASSLVEVRERRLRAAAALATFDPNSSRWNLVADAVADALLQENPLELNLWLEALRPVRHVLLPPLTVLFHHPGDPGIRRLAALVLADYAADQPALLVELMLSEQPHQYPILWPVFRLHKAVVTARLIEALDRTVPAGEGDEAQSNAARRQAQAAVLLVQLGHAERVWPLLRHRPDPTLRTWLVFLFGALQTDPRLLADHWPDEGDLSARRALVLALGECDPARLVPERREKLVAEWLTLYRDHADAGLHSAIDWTLRRRWHREEEIAALDRSLVGKPAGERRWFVNRQGQTFATFPRDLVVPADTPGGSSTRIPRAFAVATKNVTVADYDRFQKANPTYRYPDFPAEYLSGPTSPTIYLTWFDAAAYCRWLSEKEGLPETEMCYPPLEQIRPGMKMPDNYLSRIGYRMASAVESQYVSRAGATTSRFFGRGDALVAQFGWYANNAVAHVHPVGSLKPSDFGMFDAYGNVWEWSHDRAWRPEEKEDREDLKPVDGQEARLMFGGSFADQVSALRSTSSMPRKPGECHAQYGMRLVRTLR